MGQEALLPGLPGLGVQGEEHVGGVVLPDEYAISVKNGDGLPELLSAIVSHLRGLGQGEPALLTRERHRVAVVAAAVALERMTQSHGAPSELLAEDVRLAVMALERLVGRIGVEDVLDNLFAGFCIGK